METVISPGLRPLTKNEKFYARMMVWRLALGLKIIMVLGIALLPLLLLLVAEVLVNGPLPQSDLWAVLLMGAFILFMSGLLFLLGYGIDYRKEQTATRLQGVLWERTVRMNKQTVTQYFIGDTGIEVRWPVWSEEVYRRYLNTEVDLVVAELVKAPKGPMKGLLERYPELAGGGKGKSIALVLELKDKINIDGVIEKYGKYYLAYYEAKMTALILASLGVTAGGGYALNVFSWAEEWAFGSVWFVFLFILLIIAVFGVVAAFIAAVYTATRRLFDPDYGDISHEEKLRG